MHIRLGPATEAVSVQQLDALERSLGASLPIDFRVFLTRHDGSKPETNSFSVDAGNESGVNGFVPARSLARQRAALVGRIPRNILPIAWAEGGNYVCLNLADAGDVLFWDHETEMITHLADSFDEFLLLLRPFDTSSVEFKPGQVRSAWIDPEFLRSLKEQ